MRIDVLTLFPEMFETPLNCSIIKRAREQGIVQITLTNIRDFAIGKYRKVDDEPYGGGPGMVMMPGPVFECVEHVERLSPDKPRIILLTPQGRKFDQATARRLSLEKRLMLIAGRYEGFDERIRIGIGAEQISIGDYIRLYVCCREHSATRTPRGTIPSVNPSGEDLNTRTTRARKSSVV